MSNIASGYITDAWAKASTVWSDEGADLFRNKHVTPTVSAAEALELSNLRLSELCKDFTSELQSVEAMLNSL